MKRLIEKFWVGNKRLTCQLGMSTFYLLPIINVSNNALWMTKSVEDTYCKENVCCLHANNKSLCVVVENKELYILYKTRQKYFCPTLPERQFRLIKPNFEPFFNLTQYSHRPQVWLVSTVRIYYEGEPRTAQCSSISFWVVWDLYFDNQWPFCSRFLVILS